ncbi:transporter [Cryptosporangium phraense]|uniref:Transporter n=1 Tax=Cryptosporangium phraense TaxID=2593070 RepID=A0A545AJW9_9ACTN|nr:transporter [Cryptosporangium phraense]TQS41626.1 transporter [Cryptosporangium phraense]
MIAAAYERGPDHWTARILFTAAVLVVFGLIVLAARRAWKRRVAAHADLLPLPTGTVTDGIPESSGLYVGTTQAGEWQARVYAGDLANRAAATLHTGPEGVLIERDGAEPIFIPAESITGARLDAGLANKVVGGAGLLVVTWEQNGYALDTGFRADHRLDNATHLREIEKVLLENAS